jgi:hypothetical protein
MVGVHLEVNYIFAKPMKNRTGGEMIKAYRKMVDRMQLAGLGLKHHKLDSKASKALKTCIKSNKMTYMLVSPMNHQQNQAKHAIQKLKAHLISILAGVDDKFPLFLWCYLHLSQLNLP